MSIERLITQIAKTMNSSEAEVRAALDKLINPPQPYVPIQGVCKSAEFDATIRKRIRRFYRKKVRKHERRKWKPLPESYKVEPQESKIRKNEI